MHIVTHAQIGKGRGSPAAQGALSGRRRLHGLGWLAVAVPVLHHRRSARPNQDEFNLTTDVLAFLLAVIVVALRGRTVAGGRGGRRRLASC